MITITYSTLELIALGLVILNTIMVMLWFRNRDYTNNLHDLMEALTEELIGDDDQGV
jgi:uncharacterized protein YggT (Ycf19 family)